MNMIKCVYQTNMIQIKHNKLRIQTCRRLTSWLLTQRGGVEFGPLKTNPCSGREEDLNPGPLDYALALGHAHLLLASFSTPTKGITLPSNFFLPPTDCVFHMLELVPSLFPESYQNCNLPHGPTTYGLRTITQALLISFCRHSVSKFFLSSDFSSFNLAAWHF